MKKKMATACIVLMILATTILPLFHIVGATDATLTLSNAELRAQFAKEWGPGIIVGISDIGTGVRFDFTNLGSAGTAMGDNYPVNPLAGGAPDSVGGWGNFQAYTRCRLVFTNLGLDGVSVNLFMNTGWTNVDWHRDTYWESGWIYVGANESKVVTLDFSSATAWNAQDDPVPEWRYLGGTSGVIVRRLTEVSNIGFQVCGNGAGSLVVSSTTPSDTVVALPDNEVSAQFAKETGPANLVAVTVLRGMGVRLDFTGLDSSTGTVVGDSFPVSALAGGAWTDYGNGFAGPYDFSGYAKYMLLFTNVGPAEVKVNLKMNTGWTNAPWGSPERDTFWQNSWTTVPPGESRIVTLDFWSAQVWNAMNDPVPEWRHADGTIGVIVRRLDEVSDIGFQILGSGEGSIIVSGDLTLALSDAELNTQFSKETGPGAIAAITDIPGPGVKFNFTGLRTDVGTVAGDNFPVSPLAGGAYKTYGVANTFSTWGDFFEYTKYSMIFTNLGSTLITVNLKMNTGWTTPPPEYATAWRDTFWQSNWTTIAPGESEVLTLNFSSAQVYNAADEQEYRACADGTTGVPVWRLHEVSDIGFQVLGNGNASIIVSALLHPLEVYVDASYTSSTPGWGYDHFAKIQEGIDAIISGGIVHVHDGTYNEPLYISKSLTVKADSSPIVTGSQSFATKYGNREAVIFAKGATNVVLNGLDIEGQGFTGDGTKNYGIIYENSSGTVENCTVSPNMIGNMYSFGIAGWDRSNLSVEDCTVKNFGRVGVYATNVANIEINKNMIVGQPYTQSNLVSYGVEIEDWDGASAAQIVNNEIYNCGDSNPSMLWSSAAIIVDVWRYYGYALLHSAVSITYNNIHNNFEAIEFVANSMSYAHYNNICSNLYGVWTDPDENNNNASLDARFNWWGDATGPNQATTNPSALGNDAGDYVDYSPWLGFIVGTSPMTWHVNPTGTIQEAIGEASSGDTVLAHNGTYREALYIDKSIALKAASSPIIEAPDNIPVREWTGPSGTQRTQPIILVNGTVYVTIDGFTINGRGVGNTNDQNFIGIQYFSASGIITDNTIKALRDTPLSGVQSGDAIVVNHLWDQFQAHSVNISNNVVFDYQKNGITCNEPGTVATVIGNNVTGYGPTDLIAQNGVQFGWNATGVIKRNSITDHEYNLYTQGQWWSTGIALGPYSDGTIIESNNVTANDVGIDISASSGVKANCNNIYGNRLYGIYNAYDTPSPVVNATYNWWGNATGPYHGTSWVYMGSPYGPHYGLGDNVTDYVLYYPWLSTSSGPPVQPPTANFTWSPQMPRATESVTFNASSSTSNGGTIVTYTWDFGDGNITSTSNPVVTHVYANPNRYNVTLTVLDSEGLTDYVTKKVKITHIADLNLDGKVDILDISIVAKAFGTKPGDPRWNQIADVTRDGKVNIIDVSIVAKNFGWNDP